MRQAHTITFTLLVALLLAVVSILAAQENRPIAQDEGAIGIGSTVAGTLTANRTSTRYSFEGQAGDIIDIALVTEDFDAFLILQDVIQIELASDDNSGGGSDAHVGPFRLPFSGTYVIVVDSAPRQSDPNAIVTGSFTLELAFSDESVTLEVETGGPTITRGETIRAALTGDLADTTYSFTGEAGDTVIISLASSDFDSYLVLQDNNGFELDSDDDSAGSLNSRIGPYALPYSGTYQIVARALGSDVTEGNFSLSMSEPTVRLIEYTQVVEATLSPGQPFTFFRFRGQADDVVNISLETGGLEMSVYLMGADDPDFILDSETFYSYSSGQNNVLGPYTLPATGDYLIAINGLAADQAGTFSLRLSKARLVALAYGETVEATFDGKEAVLYFSFDGQSGDVVDIRVESGGTLDTQLTLNGPGSYSVTNDDDSGSGFDPEISHLILSEDGTYTLELWPYYRGDTGTVSVSLAQGIVASLDDAPHRVRLSDKRFQEALTFSGTAGERVRLTTEIIGSTQAQPTITIRQAGQILASTSASSVARSSFDFIVPRDGTVNILIEDYSYTSVILEVSLEHLD